MYALYIPYEPRHCDLADFSFLTALKLVVGNLTHKKHYLRTSKGMYNLNLQREIKLRQKNIIFCKTRGNNLKSLALIFQVVIQFHPSNPQPKTLVSSFSALI